MDWRAFTQPFSFWLSPLGKDPWFHDHWVPETQQYFWGRHRVPTTPSGLSLLPRLLGTVEESQVGAKLLGYHSEGQS